MPGEVTFRRSGDPRGKDLLIEIAGTDDRFTDAGDVRRDLHGGRAGILSLCRGVARRSA